MQPVREILCPTCWKIDLPIWTFWKCTSGAWIVRCCFVDKLCWQLMLWLVHLWFQQILFYCLKEGQKWDCCPSMTFISVFRQFFMPDLETKRNSREVPLMWCQEKKFSEEVSLIIFINDVFTHHDKLTKKRIYVWFFSYFFVWPNKEDERRLIEEPVADLNEFEEKSGRRQVVRESNGIP